jgi:hypothetical protein
MLAIFLFSATPGAEVPNFGSSGYYMKKGGHMLGFGLLALSTGMHSMESKTGPGRRGSWLCAMLPLTNFTSPLCPEGIRLNWT